MTSNDDNDNNFELNTSVFQNKVVEKALVLLNSERMFYAFFEELKGGKGLSYNLSCVAGWCFGKFILFLLKILFFLLVFSIIFFSLAYFAQTSTPPLFKAFLATGLLSGIILLVDLLYFGFSKPQRAATLAQILVIVSMQDDEEEPT
jgi:hypothetical protein